MDTHTLMKRQIVTALCVLGVIVGGIVVNAILLNTTHAQEDVRSHLLTVYDRGQVHSFISSSSTIKEALQNAGIQLDERDTVEPSRTETLVAREYKVNIYRARPVVVVDGTVRTKVMTPYQSVNQIVKDAGIALYDQDRTTLQLSTDLMNDGAGLVLTIYRSVPFTLDLYGRNTPTRTQARTVGEMLKEKNISLGQNDRLSVNKSTPLTEHMVVRVWREGKQTITQDEAIMYPIEQIYDADRPLGYRAIQTAGVEGIRSVTYEIEIKDGKELSRKQIAQFVAKHPMKQVIAVGIKGMGEGLTKAKGAMFHTDSKGVTHRETYYDLDMRTVMQSCGQRGEYTIRIDGVKVDSEGYVIIAANYARYPKCSVVETSVGPGRVYDTGGFVTRYPDGFDLATDWSNGNGY